MKLDPILDHQKIQLRDKIAHSVMKIELAASLAEGVDPHPESLSKVAYDLADAMIAERTKRIK